MNQQDVLKAFKEAASLASSNPVIRLMLEEQLIMNFIQNDQISLHSKKEALNRLSEINKTQLYNFGHTL